MIPPLTSLMAFEAVARRNSFSLAAAELNLTPSAVSHQIARLEDTIGLRLFERTTRGVSLTPAGQNYLRRVAGALGAINSATQDLRHGVQNTLYVHSSPSFASLWLMPRLARWTRAHPDIALVFSASHIHSDFQVGEVDVDIRYGLPNWPGLEIEPLFTEWITPLASPEFLATHPIASPADLVNAPLIQSGVNVIQWPEWFIRYARHERLERVALRFDRAMMSLDAAVQGLGVALESSNLAQAYLKRGQVLPLFDNKLGFEVNAHFLVYPARNASRTELMAFLNWIRAEAAGTGGGSPP